MSGGRTQESLWRAVCIAVVLVLTVMAAVGLKGEGDFTHFYEAARAVLKGQDLYASGTRGYIYPPLPAVVMAPLGLLDGVRAGIVWTVVNGLLLGTAMVVLAREVERRLEPGVVARWSWRIAALGLLFNVDKARAVLNLGQTDVMTFALIVLALRVQRMRPWACGVALGLAVNIKYQAVVFLPYLLVRGRWRESVAMLLAVVAGLLAGAPVFGWSTNLDYLSRAFGGLLEMAGVRARSPDAADIHPITWDRSVSLVSVAARARAAWGAAWALWVIPAVAAGACLALGWWMYAQRGLCLWAWQRSHDAVSARREWIELLEWCGLVTAVLVFSPQSTTRHFFLMTFVTTVCAALLVMTSRYRALLICAVVALAAGLMLPPGGEQFRAMQQAWRAVGGASVCALVLYFAVLWAGLARVEHPGRARQFL